MNDGGFLSWGKDYCCPAVGVVIVEVWTSLFVGEIAVAKLFVAV